ncbi:MAG: NAD(P)-binding protein, partial [Chitinivibrionales bacterium]|nr:NAD(P)-binding protein [Chitinivibrionales bacterium]
MSPDSAIIIIGAGLAGSEAALVLASRGIPVTLYEMRPHVMTPAHRTELPAELVCSNSLKAKTPPSAHGLLKEELRMLRSPLLDAATQNEVPAGGALAVDRDRFSKTVLLMLQRAGVNIVRKEITEPPQDTCAIIAAGPLASDPLVTWLTRRFSAEALNFYDAIAPVIDADSVDKSKIFFASRRDSESSDYCNCPFTKEEYARLYTALLEA